MLQNDIKEVLISEEQLQEKARELGAVLTEDYKGKYPLAIGVLKGAMPFMGDLMKRIDGFVEMDFMDVSSYGNATVSSGEVKIVKDLNASVEGRAFLHPLDKPKLLNVYSLFDTHHCRHLLDRSMATLQAALPD